MGWEDIYDAKEGTFLGRTASSWFKILGFYAIYYTFLGFLFYGSVQFGMIRIQQTNVLGMDKGAGRPVTNTRTDQPGVDAWPQNMVIADNQGLEFELGKYELVNGDKSGVKKCKDDKCPLYVKKLQQYLLNYCPFKDNCALSDLMGADWAKTIDFIEEGTETDPKCKDGDNSRKCVVYKSCKDSKSGCGNVMVINHTKLRAKITTDDNDQINKPYFFVSINKVIKFTLQGYGNFQEMAGRNPVSGKPSPTFQNYKPTDYQLSAEELQTSAFVNCYIFDTGATKGQCKPWSDKNNTRKGVGADVDCDNLKAQSKYKVNPIRPYILNKNYEYKGFAVGEDDQNQKSALYAKPFAMFQMTVESGKIENKNDDSFVRCNVVAKNIEYPYLANEALMGNPLLSQPGHGWVQLGFLEKPEIENSA